MKLYKVTTVTLYGEEKVYTVEAESKLEAMFKAGNGHVIANEIIQAIEEVS